MKVFLALLALSGWALAIAFRVIATREQKRRMFAELTPTHSEHIPLLPVDAILDSLPLGVVVVDINGREQFRNSVARDASGARHEAVLIDAVIERLSRLAVNGSAATEQMELASALGDAGLSIYPQSEDMLAIGGLLAMTNQDWQLAVELIEELVEIQGEKTPPFTLVMLVRALRCNLDPERALAVARHGLSLYPEQLELQAEKLSLDDFSQSMMPTPSGMTH